MAPDPEKGSQEEYLVTHIRCVALSKYKVKKELYYKPKILTDFFYRIQFFRDVFKIDKEKINQHQIFIKIKAFKKFTTWIRYQVLQKNQSWLFPVLTFDI